MPKCFGFPFAFSQTVIAKESQKQIQPLYAMPRQCVGANKAGCGCDINQAPEAPIMSHVGPQPGPDDDTDCRPPADMTSITGRTPEYFAIIIIEFQHLSELWVTHRQSNNQ